MSRAVRLHTIRAIDDVCYNSPMILSYALSVDEVYISETGTAAR